MPNYEELKKKAKDALDTIADVSVEAYRIAEEKARNLARRAKLNAEITREKAIIRRAKTNIGGIYYDLHKNEPEPALDELCGVISVSLELIAAKQCEIDELKTKATEAECCDCCDGEEDGECECPPECDAECPPDCTDECCAGGPVAEEPVAEEPVAEEPGEPE